MNTSLGVTIKKEPITYESDDTYNLYGDNDPGSRCGEIFVGNNAKTWTFICTLCDKSMQKFDEFIMHIKHSHINLPPPLPLDENVTSHQQNEHNNSNRPEVPQLNPLDRVMNEYVDYNDFLDVNVQTIPEVILSETNGKMQPSQAKQSTPQPPLRIKSEPGTEKSESKSSKPEKPAAKLATKLATKPTTKPSNTSRLPTISGQAHIPQLLVRPRRQRKDRLRQKQIKGPAFCQICQREFQYYSLYRNHMVKHTSETPFQCALCKKGFKSKQAIRYHMSTHQREKPFQCELCGSGFYHEWQFVSHMETHKSENRHPCEICGKVNRTKFEKEVHMRTHTGDRPFGCEFCCKRFRLRHHLSNHLKLHLTYRCDYCRKQFSNGVPMKKPYACEDCAHNPKNIRSPEIYKEEDDDEEEEESESEQNVEINNSNSVALQDTDPMRPHTCKICKKTYANKRGLGVHITTKHQNKH